MGEQSYDIYKVAGIVVEDRQVLATRTRGREYYDHPGGKPEGDETDIDTLIRELYEELGIDVTEDSVEKVDDYYADVTGQPGKRIKLAAYLITRYSGIIVAQREIEEVRFFSSDIPEGIEMASIFSDHTLPLLKGQNLID